MPDELVLRADRARNESLALWGVRKETPQAYGVVIATDPHIGFFRDRYIGLSAIAVSLGYLGFPVKWDIDRWHFDYKSEKEWQQGISELSDWLLDSNMIRMISSLVTSYSSSDAIKFNSEIKDVTFYQVVNIVVDHVLDVSRSRSKLSVGSTMKKSGSFGEELPAIANLDVCCFRSALGFYSAAVYSMVSDGVFEYDHSAFLTNNVLKFNAVVMCLNSIGLNIKESGRRWDIDPTTNVHVEKLLGLGLIKPDAGIFFTDLIKAYIRNDFVNFNEMLSDPHSHFHIRKLLIRVGTTYFGHTGKELVDIFSLGGDEKFM